MLQNQSASIELKMSTVNTPALSNIMGACLLPLSYGFGIVVCFEIGLSYCWLLVDGLAIWVAEDLRTCCDAKDPY